ncbi:MAG: KamA family radical SAM protein [Candidatus Aminicenantes bacterium]|nr:KamA family radical SAM protein [Candidatus Aminicenantes bacterium]
MVNEAESPSEEAEPPSSALLEDSNNSGLSLLFPELIQFPLPKPDKTFHKIGIRSLQFLRKYFPLVSKTEWNNWEWQLRNSITSWQTLQQLLQLDDEEVRAMTVQSANLPLRITPYYASLLDPLNSMHPLRRSVVPVTAEHLISPGEAADPLGEDTHSRVPGLVHRYPDRVLFLVTGFCSSYCRYCTRSRLVGDQNKRHLNREQWDRALTYIELNPSVRDVLLSGGDPLTLPDDSLEYLLSRLSKIPHVEVVRIGTKIPVVLPQRITHTLINVLKRFRPLWMSIHFTHPDEITPESAQACERLADAGIPLGSQTVLLKDINDSVPTMKKLMHELLKIRVRPYYLYQCDPILGSSHFRTPVQKGLEIIEGLRGHTSGYAVPHYVIDAPQGGGKIPLLPDYYQGRQNHDVLLRNYQGNIYRYPDQPDEVGKATEPLPSS